MTYTPKDITKDLSFLMSLTKIFSTDDKGYWFDTMKQERFVYAPDPNTDGKPIVLFQDPIPHGDHYLFNPFAEGFGPKSPAVQLYYRSIEAALNLNLSTILLYMVRTVSAYVEAGGEGSATLSHSVQRMASGTLDGKTTLGELVDGKTEKEFDTILSRMNNEIVLVSYMRQMTTAKLLCQPLTSSGWAEKVGKGVRKKTLDAFKTALVGILGLPTATSLPDFDVKYNPNPKSAAEFSTKLSVYYQVYNRINDVLPEAYSSADGELSMESAVDLGEFGEVIERLPQAYAIAKHMVQPVKVAPTSLQTADTSHLSGAVDAAGNRRFTQTPQPVGGFGRQPFPQPAPQALSPTGARRFITPGTPNPADDPLSPAIRRNPGGFGMMGQPMGGFGGPSFAPGGFGGGFGTGFGGFQSGGFGAVPPSNFGMPNTQRRF
jgi:hypothetical protein